MGGINQNKRIYYVFEETGYSLLQLRMYSFDESTQIWSERGRDNGVEFGFYKITL